MTMDYNKHKFFMLQILRDIYTDPELSNALIFKGGTALMFFYNLPRVSIDLDFNPTCQKCPPSLPQKPEFFLNFS